MLKLNEKQRIIMNNLHLTIKEMNTEFIENPSFENFIESLQIFDEQNFYEIDRILEDNLNDLQM